MDISERVFHCARCLRCLCALVLRIVTSMAMIGGDLQTAVHIERSALSLTHESKIKAAHAEVKPSTRNLHAMFCGAFLHCMSCRYDGDTGCALQVYVHHYVSSSKFILGNGAELRGSFTRQPLLEPYALVVDTEDLKDDLIRRDLLTGHPLIQSILFELPEHPRKRYPSEHVQKPLAFEFIHLPGALARWY